MLPEFTGGSGGQGSGGGGVTDHGALIGLADDDHPQYGHLSQNEVVVGRWTFTGSPEFYGPAIHNISFNGDAKVTFFTKVEFWDDSSVQAGNLFEVDGTLRVDGILGMSPGATMYSEASWNILSGTHTYASSVDVDSAADYIYRGTQTLDAAAVVDSAADHIFRGTHTYNASAFVDSSADHIFRGDVTLSGDVSVFSAADYIFSGGTQTLDGNATYINSAATYIYSGAADYSDARWISPTTSGAPSLNVEAEVKYNEADDQLYYYDATRSKWLSVDSITIPFGRPIAGAGSVLLHTPSAQSSTTFGVYTGKLARIVGAAANINTTNSSVSVRLRQGVGTTTLLTFSSNRRVADYTLDVALNSTVQYGIDVSGGTNTVNGFLLIKFHWN